MSIKNTDIVTAIAAKFPTFNGHTAKDAFNLLTANGYDQMAQLDPTLANDFYGLLVRVWLSQINISQAKDNLEASGFGESFAQPFGGITQRMSVDSVKPISAGWIGLKDGDSPDPFVVRKPKVNDRFYKANFRYASLVTVPDEITMRNMYVSEYGISETIGGIMKGLENGYIIEKYLMKKNALNAMINPKVGTLRDTQKVTVPFSIGSTTAEQYENFVIAVKDAVTMMEISPQTGAFNVAGFKTSQDVSRLKLLIRAGIKNRVSVSVLSTMFNQENLNLPVDVIEVPDFGGLEPYKESEFTTPLYPVYDSLGSVIGYNEAKDAKEVTVQEDAVFWKDPNADVIAVLADKGAVFTQMQGQYSVEPIRNPRGKYTNYWASLAGDNGIYTDYNYNWVVFTAGV